MQNLLMSDHTHISGLFDNSLQKSTTEFAAYIILNVLKSENPELAYICFSGDNLVILGEMGWLWRHPQHLGASFQHQALHSPLLWGWVNEKNGWRRKEAFFYIVLSAIVGDSSRLGGPLPKPTIKASRQAGEGEWFHYIEVLLLRLLANSKSISDNLPLFVFLWL